MQRQLSKLDKQEIGSLLLDVGRAGTYLANCAIGVDAPQKSLARKMLEDPLNTIPTWRGDQPIRRAHEDTLIACLAGIDHLRGFVSAIRGPQPVGVSFASLARGGVEAFSRAFFLLDSSTASDLVGRHGSLAMEDLKYTVKLNPGESLATWVGDKIDTHDYQKLIQKSLERPGIKRTDARRTGLAKKLLDESLRGGGALAYSQLSAVAHGESFAINHFLRVLTDDDRSGDQPNVSLGIPRDTAIEYGIYLLATCREVQSRLIEVFQPYLGARETWNSAYERSDQRMKRLDESRRG